jgi:hyaluronate lyase
MERAVARRAGWSWALSMSSNRVAAYEMGNWENLHGWYLGDGMTYLYLRTDPRHFNDEFWPTANPYRLPGTTVDTRVREVIGATEGMVKHLPDNDVAGGASLADRYAVAAMQLIADGSSLRAKKAWFVLDNAIVALGTDINATDGRNVVTTVEHRNLGEDGTNRLTVNGNEQPTEDGWSDNLDGARWIHLEGVGGYLFPEGATGLRGLREVRTGAWNDIEQGPTTGGGDMTLHTRRYATIWYDHGVSPAAAAYAYVLLPTADATTTATLSGTEPVNILKNTAAVQAIKANGGDLIAAHFWEAGDVGGITCDGPASILVHRSDAGIKIAVADSSRTTTQITVEIPFPATEVAEAERTVEVELGERPRIIVKTEGTLGTTHKARLN